MEITRTIAKGLRAITKPAKLLHFKITNPASNAFKDGLTAVLSFGGAVIIFFLNAPFKGIGELLFVLLVCFILAWIFVLIISFCYPIAQKILALILAFPAWVYDYCDDTINHVERKKKGTMGAGQKPKVGIKYFIEREKRIQINHAKWLG